MSASFETSLQPSATKARALCPAWATNTSPSNQSRFEVEYPGGTSQSRPTFPLPLTAGFPRYATSRTLADRKNPKASAACEVSPNFECRVKRSPTLQDVKPRISTGKTCASISGSYRPIGVGKCRPCKQQNGRRNAGRFKGRRSAIIARLCAEPIAASAPSWPWTTPRIPRGMAGDRYSAQRPW
jgi:hypothetical protein